MVEFFGLFLLFTFSALTNDAQGFIFKRTKILPEDEAKDQMLAGNGGTAVVDVGLGDRLIVIKEKLYTCRDLEILGSTVKCPSGYDKFEIKNSKDMCYTLRYSIVEDRMTRLLCLSPNDEPVNLYIENNQVVCKASTRSLNATMITEENYYRICQRRITDPIKVQFFAKSRDSMPSIRGESVHCSHYMCVFMTYRDVDKKVDGNGVVINPMNMTGYPPSYPPFGGALPPPGPYNPPNLYGPGFGGLPGYGGVNKTPPPPPFPGRGRTMDSSKKLENDSPEQRSADPTPDVSSATSSDAPKNATAADAPKPTPDSDAPSSDASKKSDDPTEKKES